MRKISNEELGRLSPEEFAQTDKLPFTVVLDNIRSLHNVGSFFRTADAFAINEIILCGITATPPNKEIHKTALGSENTVSWRYYSSSTDALSELRQQGYTLVAVEQVEGAMSLQNFTPEKNVKYALIFGNEVFGVSQEIVDMCDMGIEIPQLGTKHSLNVSVCGGVVLWSLFEKSRLKP